jgi:hypothetical protein
MKNVPLVPAKAAGETPSSQLMINLSAVVSVGRRRYGALVAMGGGTSVELSKSSSTVG